MTLEDLREKTKEACLRARQADIIGFRGSRFRGLNMRQAWEENSKVIKYLLADGADLNDHLDSALVQFHYAGEIYYHAKEHGLKSAMMLKLQRL